MKTYLMAALLAGATVVGVAPVLAQAPIPVEAAAGVKVLDTAGGEVGVVDKVEGDVVTVNTGRNVAALPRASFAASTKGLVLGMTKDQLDAAIDKAKADAAAALQAQIVVGAEIRGADATTILGKVSEVTETDFVLTGDKGGVRLGKTAVVAGPNGPMVGLTPEQMAAAIAGAAAPASN